MIKIKWLELFKAFGSKVWDGVAENFKTSFIDSMKLEVALTSIHEEEYESEEVKEIVRRIKGEWSNSPETPSQFVESLMSVFKGQLASLQLQNMVNVRLDSDSPVSQAMFKQLGIITDLTLLASSLSVIGEVVSIGQIDKLGDEMRAYLDYSGLSQITGFGYGMILSNAVSPLITQEINKQVQPGLIDPDRALNMLYREIMSQEQYFDNMIRQGYTGQQIGQYQQAYMFYPNPTDFISFAVRDVFDEAVVTKWQYDANFPAQMEPYVRRAGMDLEILRWYWRAHWQLPSPTMGFEMMHRGAISLEELEELLRISDYAPGYIPKLIEISYSPYTRVDARRMYEAGVLDEDGLKQAYKDIGYDDERASKLVEWIQTDAVASEKDLSRAMIIKAYNLGLLDRGRAGEYIGDLGYSPDESELILSLEDTDKEQKQIEESLKVLRTQYLKSVIGDTEFKGRASALGLSEAEVSRQLFTAQNDRDKKIKEPTKAEVQAWFTKGLISVDQYRQRLANIGYQEDVIELFILEAAA